MQSLFRRSNRMHVASYARGVQSKATPILARNGLNNSVIPARLACASNPHVIRPLTPASLPAYPPHGATRLHLALPRPRAQIKMDPPPGGSTVSQIWTGYNDVTMSQGISYENGRNRVSCGGPLTTEKLTRSCADPNPGAIMYTQFTTDIVLEVNERCKQLALGTPRMRPKCGPPTPATSVVMPRPTAKWQMT